MEDNKSQPPSQKSPKGTSAPTGTTPPAQPAKVKSKGGKKRRALVPFVALAAALIVGSGAAAYLSIFNKSAEDKFYSALGNTANALEEIEAIDTSSTSKTIEGSIDVDSPLAVDGTINGSFDNDGNGIFTADAGAIGARVSAEARTVAVENSDAPDIYFNVSGLSGIGGLIGSFGGTEASGIVDVLSQLDGEWYSADHTLIEQALLSGDDSGETVEFSEEQLDEIRDRVLQPVRERLLGSEDDKAVFVVSEELGDEEFEGDGTTKVRVGVNKDNLIAFIDQYESVIKDTPLKDLVEQSGSSVDDIDFSEIRDQLQEVDFDGASADVWLSGDRFIRNIRLYPLEDKKDTNYIDFSLDYEGGDIFPLTMKLVIDDDGVKGDATLGFSLNRTNGDLDLSIAIAVDTDDGVVVDADASLAIASSDEAVSVEVPDATNVLGLLGLLGGLGGGGLEQLGGSEADLQTFELDDVELSL